MYNAQHTIREKGGIHVMVSDLEMNGWMNDVGSVNSRIMLPISHKFPIRATNKSGAEGRGS